MNCTFAGDDSYDELWVGLEKHCIEMGETSIVELGDIFISPLGVAVENKLQPPLSELYDSGSVASPHVTLKTAVGCEAKSLGPLLRASQLTNDWVNIFFPRWRQC